MKTIILLISLLLFSPYLLADGSGNGSCNGEVINELHGISTNFTHTETGSVKHNNPNKDRNDYYYFKPGVAGTLTVNYSSDASSDFKLSKVSCDSNKVLNNGTSYSGSLTISATDTVYIRVKGESSSLNNYSIDFDFTLAGGGGGGGGGGGASTIDYCANPSGYPDDILPATNTSGTDANKFRRILINDANGECMNYANIKGGLIQIGNQTLCAMDNTVSTSECIDPESKAYFKADGSYDGCADSSYDDGCQNNDFQNGPDSAYLGLADYDDNPLYGVSATEAVTTTNSTMARLTLKSGDTVLWAKLYWSGRTGNNSYNDVKNVKFMTPTTGGVYEDVTCTHYGSKSNEYYCAADVTSHVTQSGEYWVGNIKAREKSSNNYGAWSLAVVYQNKDDVFTNISMYEGFDSFYNNSLTIPVSGFLTPARGDINASFHIFSGESDNGYGDYVDVQNSSGFQRLANPVGPNNDFLNATIARYGQINTDRLPNFTNALGIDIDSLVLKDPNGDLIMEQNQSSTAIQFTSTQDQLFVPFIAMTTELYEPKFCYDYAYSQNGRFFTEENNGSAVPENAPHISGDVIPGTPVLTRIYVKNLEINSRAANVKLNITDLNSTNEGYFDGNITRTEPNGLVYSIVPNSDILYENHTGTAYKLADAIRYDEGVYTQFNFMPTRDTLDVPLNMTLDFDIEINGTPLEYHGLTLNDRIPLCTQANFTYNPSWGIFNVEDHNLSATGIYNLYTQVAKRPFQVDVVSYDSSASPETLKPASTVVAVEMIDAGGYHDVNVSCTDPHSAITNKVWVQLNNSIVSPIDIPFALSNNMTIATENSFFAQARENTAFRVSFLTTNDVNASIMETSIPSAGFIAIDNYTEMTAGLTTCASSADDISTMCAGADTVTGMPQANLRACMECLYGRNTNFVCSRDNFAIRPEALLVKISDNDQSTNPLNPLLELPKVSDIAAGYNYRYDINATSHRDEKAVNGYTQSYLVPMPDHNLTFYWKPQTSVSCNDTADKYPAVYLINGSAANYQNKADNVGRYELNMIDTSWTQVDQSPQHHLLHPTHFYTNDCTLDEHFVPSEATTLNRSNVGCNINSTHTNEDRTSVVYSDYNVTVHPYKFNISTIIPSHGLVQDTNFTTPTGTDAPFVYMANLNNGSDENMSVQFRGNILAEGFDSVVTSNFTNGCFAKPLNIDVARTVSTALPSDGANYTYHYKDFNVTGDVINALNGIVNNSAINNILSVGTTSFPQVLSGAANIALMLNFDRNTSVEINPISVTFSDLNVSCQTPTDCQSHADMTAFHDANGTQFYPAMRVDHYYGAMFADTGINVLGNFTNLPIRYNIYCTDTGANACTNANYPKLRAMPATPGTVRHFVNTEHNDLIDGRLSAISQNIAGVTRVTVTTPLATPSVAGVVSHGILYDATAGYAYIANMDIFAPEYLLTSPVPINAFQSQINFLGNGQWSGVDEHNATNTRIDSGVNTNRRINW